MANQQAFQSFALANKLTALSQLDMVSSYRVQHVPIHTVFAFVAFVQVVLDPGAN